MSKTGDMYLRESENKDEIISDLLEALKLAEYKMYEMLQVGHFEDDAQENFARALVKIKVAIAKAEGKS